MSASPVTILDVASALGLSPTTVSSALHGRGRVSERTRTRVVEQAERMGYVTNRAAQALRGGKHDAIGLHLISSAEAFVFYMEFIFGVTEVAAGAGKDVVLFTEGGTRVGARSLNVDGLIALDPVPEDRFVSDALRRGIPLVAVGPYRGPLSDRLLGTIDAAQGRLTARVLDELRTIGGTAPALLNIERSSAPQWALEVESAYVAWCRGQGLEPRVFGTAVHPISSTLDEVILEAERAGDTDSFLVVQQGVAAQLRLRAAALGLQARPLATLTSDWRSEQDITGLVSLDLRPREYGKASASLLLGRMSGETIEPSVLHEATLQVS